MKQACIGIVACLLALAMCFGCAKAKLPEQPAEADASTSTEMIGMPSPVHDMESYKALLAAQPAAMLLDAPEGATGVTYCYIDNDPTISQIQFTYEGNDYTYRAAAVPEAAQADIAGIYEELGKTEQLKVEDNVTMGGAYTLRYQEGSTMGLATWYYAPTGCQYSLWTATGCDVNQSIEEVVDLLLPIANDANGNPLSPAASTPLPVVIAGSVKGTVVDIQPNTLVLQLENNNTLQFLLSTIATPDANVGDVVEIAYSGNILDDPEAVTISVITAAPEETDAPATSVSGSVMQHTKNSVFVMTTSNNVFGFIIDGNTAFKGQSTSLKSGNQVTVTYTGDLANAPLATVIETTSVNPDAERTAKPEPEEPVDKTLKGTVTSLTTKRVSLYSDTGHSYTFQRDGSTIVTGNYMLEYGCRIRVLYDGYASQEPLARRIDVLAPPDPTPPEPTPYKPVKRTINGYVSMTAGNALVVEADNGNEYSFLLRAPSISGDIVVGYRITVTYLIEEDGTYNATKIVTSPPVVYEPDPELVDSPLGGMISFDEADPEADLSPEGGSITFD